MSRKWDIAQMGCRAAGMSRNWDVAKLKCRASEKSCKWDVARMGYRANGCRPDRISRKKKVAQMAFSP